MHCPEDGLDQFEEISFLLKNKELIDINQFLRVNEERPYNRPNPEMTALTSKFIQKASKLFNVKT
jgi:hypothetical protein